MVSLSSYEAIYAQILALKLLTKLYVVTTAWHDHEEGILVCIF